MDSLLELAQHIRLLYSKEMPDRAFTQSIELIKMFVEERQRRYGHEVLNRTREYQRATHDQIKDEIDRATTKKS